MPIDSGRPSGNTDAALVRALFAHPSGSSPVAAAPPWAAAVRLAPIVPRRAATSWPLARRPLTAAAAVLLAGGLVASSVGAAPAMAAVAGSPFTAIPAVAAVGTDLPTGDHGALDGLRVASAIPDQGLLGSLLAAPVPDDRALLHSLLAEPVELPAFELAAEAPAAGGVMAVAAPAVAAAVSFNTVALLPSSAASYQLAPLTLPAVTIEAQQANTTRPSPPPPAPPPAQNSQGQQQPPAPPGYVQPPGYQDGVPFGGQIGAVPSTTRPTTRPGTTRPTTTRPSAPSSTRPVTTRPAVYVVQAGDTLSTIALRFYGDARYAELIWETNIRVIGLNPNVIVPGQRLSLPGLAVQAPVQAPVRSGLLPTTPIAPRSFYVIQPNDYLRWMSQRAYGNEALWPEIYGANRAVLGPNPDLILPGQRVFIP